MTKPSKASSQEPRARESARATEPESHPVLRYEVDGLITSACDRHRTGARCGYASPCWLSPLPRPPWLWLWEAHGGNRALALACS